MSVPLNNVTEAALAAHADLSHTDLSDFPARVDREAGAAIITKLLFPVSKRTIEAWPLTVRRVNNRAVYETRELLDYARAMFDAAPAIRGGRKRTKQAA